MKRVIFLAIFILGFVFAPKTFAYVLTTFQAENYSPSSYIGKNFPITGSKVNLGTELILGGKIQDLKNYKIYWYLDGKLIDKGYGLKQTSFTVRKTSGYDCLINIEIKKGGKSYESSLVIPIKSPLIIVQHPSFLKKKDNTFKVLPYFFNIKSLSELDFSWLVNGLKKQGDNLLNLSFDNYQPGKIIRISARASNKNNLSEIGKSKLIELSTF